MPPQQRLRLEDVRVLGTQPQVLLEDRWQGAAPHVTHTAATNIDVAASIVR